MNTTTTTTTTTTEEPGVTTTSRRQLLHVEMYKGHEIQIQLRNTQRVYGPTSWKVEFGQIESGAVTFESNISWRSEGVGYSTGNIDAKTNTPDEIPTSKRIALSMAAAKKVVDRHVDDEAMRPQLAQLVNMNCETIPAVSRMPQVGDVACLYSRGTDRFGLVTKVTPSKIEIAYVTQGGLDEAARYNRVAKITRKAQPIGSVKVIA